MFYTYQHWNSICNTGYVLKKGHRAISFKQANFLKPFIEFNTEKRKNAKNDFEKDLFKLMNNSVEGKTMENVRKHGGLWDS